MSWGRGKCPGGGVSVLGAVSLNFSKTEASDDKCSSNYTLHIIMSSIYAKVRLDGKPDKHISIIR